MCFLKFILLLLIPSKISGGCQSNISVSGGQNICSGQYFNLTCQFACHGQQNHVKLLKDQQLLRRVESSNNSITLFIQVHSANKNNSGTYNCLTEPVDSISMAYLIVEDCVFPSQSSSSSSSSSSPPLATTYQSPTPSRILAPVLIWYILFKTVVFLIGSITAALKVRSTKK